MQLRSCAARLRQRTLLAVLTALIPVGSLHAGTVLYVDEDAPPNGNGESWDSPYRFLADALDAAAESNAGVNEIRIARGIYYPDRSEATPGGSGNRSASFELVNGLALRGGYRGFDTPDPDERDPELYESTLSGDLAENHEPLEWGEEVVWDDDSYHVVKAIETIPASTLDGLTISRGNADGPGDLRGAGICLVDGELNVIDCEFRWNQARSANSIHARGGAIWSAGSILNVTRTLFHRNRARSSLDEEGAAPPGGGAIAASASSVTLTDCEFYWNRVWAIFDCKGGALWAATNTDVTMTNCFFNLNLATSAVGDAAGGAMLLSSATMSALRCVYVGNKAWGGSASVYIGDAGGGVCSMWNSLASFEACEFLDNRVQARRYALGGAVESADSTLHFGNCLLAGQDTSASHGAQRGSAIYISDTLTTVINSLVVDNSCRSWGEGSAIDQGGGLITITNSVVWGNDGGESLSTEEQQLDSPPSQFQISYSCVEGWTGSYGGAGNHGLDPLFVDPTGPDFRLISGSPCVDAGDNSATTSETDLGGNDRFVDDPHTGDTGIGTPPLIDMGPYEVQLGPCPMDLNDNGRVDFHDLLLLLGAWNDPYSFLDLLELLGTWGYCP